MKSGSIPRKGSDRLNTLLLRLSAPLQSWGSDSLYDHRETDSMPTKSGVIGILAAALGRKRDESLEDLAKLRFGVRVDFPGTKIEDFQITQMGEGINSNLSYRNYLSDAIFLVGLSCEDAAFLEELEHALRNPKFSVFLGRRSCPPTQPLVLGIREKELEQALRDEEWLVPEWRRRSLFRFSERVFLRIVTDGVQGDAVKKDVPVSFSPYRREYGYRYTREVSGTVMTKSPVPAETEHDAMSELR